MGLKPEFTKGDIQSVIERKLAGYRRAILARLKQAGEKFVNLARESGNYQDQTGNLRSSIGYIIMYDGMPLFEYFPGAAAEGRAKGLELANKEASHSGYCLVGVAGMEYAAAVESLDNYDVISGSATIVEHWLKQAIRNLNSKL